MHNTHDPIPGVTYQTCFCSMESENGVSLEDKKCISEEKSVEGSAVDVMGESQNADIVGGKIPTMNGNAEPSGVVTKSESLNSSNVAVKASATVQQTKNSNTINGPHAGTNGFSKNSNITKDKPTTMKGTAPLSRNQKAILSQSLSFPARGARGDGLQKSIDAMSVKNGGGTRIKTATPSAKGAVTSASHLYNPNRRASAGVQTKEHNTTSGASVRRTSLAATLSTKRSMSMKSGSTNATTNSLPSDTSLPAEKSLPPAKTALPVKEEDDAHSTTSSSTSRGRRSSGGAGFAFRLDERAAKRKEFFTKLEEKIQAKEEEITNLQAKSKESQEAEIKQLRKSMTFKATPMPSFYREPPPKTELKKIPTTRAKSPRLGRNKNSISAPNSSEGSGSCLSPRLIRGQNNSSKGLEAKCEKEVAETQKQIRKSQPTLHFQENVASKTKTEAKPVKSKPKTTDKETQNQKAGLRGTKEIQDQNSHLPECKDEIKLETEMNVGQNNTPVTSPPATEIMPQEVPVGV